MKIGYVTSSVGRSYDSDDNSISGKFQNNIIDGLPFGIDICLDYGEASVQQDQHRISQLNERHFKLDFLLAAGMGLDINNYAKTPHIQYAIRNEGITTCLGNPVEVWKLSWTPGKPSVTTKKLVFGTWMDWIDKFPSKASKEDLGTLESKIAIDQSEIFDAPEGADTKDIPNIHDKMNAGLVSVWQLDMVQPADAVVVASNLVPTTKVADKTIQFIK